MSTQDTFYTKFVAPVVPQSVALLMQIVDAHIKQGAKRMKLLISTPGCDVFHGLSVYHFLKGIPLEIVTHNFGSANSIPSSPRAATSTRNSSIAV